MLPNNFFPNPFGVFNAHLFDIKHLSIVSFVVTMPSLVKRVENPLNHPTTNRIE